MPGYFAPKVLPPAPMPRDVQTRSAKTTILWALAELPLASTFMAAPPRGLSARNTPAGSRMASVRDVCSSEISTCVIRPRCCARWLGA